MTRADRDGDHTLLKAYAEEVSRRAMDPLAQGGGYAELFRQWAANQTGGTEAVEELQAITFELTDPGQRMVRDSDFGVSMPAELAGYGNLKALADQADSIEELPPTRAEQVGDRLAAFARGDGGGY